MLNHIRFKLHFMLHWNEVVSTFLQYTWNETFLDIFIKQLVVICCRTFFGQYQIFFDFIKSLRFRIVYKWRHSRIICSFTYLLGLWSIVAITFTATLSWRDKWTTPKCVVVLLFLLVLLLLLLLSVVAVTFTPTISWRHKWTTP